MSAPKKPTPDLIQAAQEMAEHRRGELALPMRKAIPPDTVDAQHTSTVKRWLEKPGFKKVFEKEYKDFLASDKSECDGIHNVGNPSDTSHNS